MWRVFASAFVRKLAYVLAGAVLALLLGHKAMAAGCFTWSDTTGVYKGVDPVGVARAALAGGANSHTTFSVSGCSLGGAPTATGQASVCSWTEVVDNGGCGSCAGTITIFSAVATCSPSCGSLPNADLLATMASGTPTGSGTLCNGGCEYANGNTTLVVGGGANRLAGQAVPTGQACSAGDTAASIGSNCFVVHGTTICSDAGTGSAVVNSDVVPVVSGAPSPGTCVAYASGGVACTVAMTNPGTAQAPAVSTVAAPPGPDDGTPGVPAVPDAQGVAGSHTVNYYKPATVAASSGAIATQSGAGGTPLGTTVGTTGAPGVGSGACLAGQNCTGVTDAFSGGGDCVTPPSCTNTDPVQCGIANQEWLFRCESAADSDVASAIGSVGEVAASSVDMSNVLSESSAGSWGSVSGGSGTCPAPISVTVMGRTMSWDIWGRACEFAGMIAFLVLAVAYMVAARIVYQGAVSNST